MRSLVTAYLSFLGGCEDGIDDVLDSVEYCDFEKPCDKGDTKEETASTTSSTVMSSLSSWTTHSELVLSVPSTLYGAVALGSCLLVVGIYSYTQASVIVQVLDTTHHRHRVWNLPPIGHNRDGSLVTVATPQPLVAVVGGHGNLSCATISVADKNTMCFCRLLEQPQHIVDHVSQKKHDKRARLIAGPGSSSTGH